MINSVVSLKREKEFRLTLWLMKLFLLQFKMGGFYNAKHQGLPGSCSHDPTFLSSILSCQDKEKKSGFSLVDMLVVLLAEAILPVKARKNNNK